MHITVVVISVWSVQTVLSSSWNRVMASCLISSTWKMEERIITAVFVLGFLRFYDPSLTAYKVSAKPKNPWRKMMEVAGPSAL